MLLHYSLMKVRAPHNETFEILLPVIDRSMDALYSVRIDHVLSGRWRIRDLYDPLLSALPVRAPSMDARMINAAVDDMDDTRNYMDASLEQQDAPRRRSRAHPAPTPASNDMSSMRLLVADLLRSMESQ